VTLRRLAGGVPVRHLDLPDHVHGSLFVPRQYKSADRAYPERVAFLRSIAMSEPAA
jgi:hypothetical protein